jgi:hypothetical protein
VPTPSEEGVATLSDAELVWCSTVENAPEVAIAAMKLEVEGFEAVVAEQEELAEAFENTLRDERRDLLGLYYLIEWSKSGEAGVPGYPRACRAAFESR